MTAGTCRWPGHLGSFSMMGADGIYGMMNAGSDRPGNPPPLRSKQRWAAHLPYSEGARRG